MTHPFRFLADGNSSAKELRSEDADGDAVNSDFVVILAALLCALICVLGLVAVARCAWLRRFSFSSPVTGLSAAQQHHSVANKGLRKKILRTLPKLTYSAELEGKFTECPICLTEFAADDELRVLPQCGHGFHVGCIDTWLGSHSSCPSCRQILVAAARCQKCGLLPQAEASSSTGADQTEARRKEREDDINRFLP